MNKSIANVLWFSIFPLLLFGCSNQDSQLTPTSMLLPSATVIPTRTEQKPTQIPTETLTPTATPYPAKQVILDYYYGGGPLPFDDLLGRDYSILVLYSDRQMIITGRIFQQKILTGNEMNQFLSQLENLGFYNLESNQKHDPTDQLYDFGTMYQFQEMGLSFCVVTTEKPRNLCAYDPYRKFLVPAMKNILNFLDNYKPEGMTLYSPDRLLLKIQTGRASDVQAEAIPWSEDFPSLERIDNGILYVEGKIAMEIFSLFDGEPSHQVVIQNGIEYTIEYDRPVLPHEVISSP